MNISFFTPQRLMKIGVAIIFDFVKFIFSILFILAPVIACIAGAAAVSSYLGGGSWLQGVGCAASGLLVGAAEWFTGGLGAAAIQAVGEVFADALDFAAWVIFYLWFTFSGTKFLSGKRGTTKLIAAATSAIAGLVPFLNIAPTITIGVVVIEWNQWKEDMSKAANDNDAASARAQQISAQREALMRLQEQRMIEQQEAELQDAA